MIDILITLVTAGVTAIVTATITTYVNGKVIDAKLADLKDRIVRIEHYLNGLIEKDKQ